MISDSVISICGSRARWRARRLSQPTVAPNSASLATMARRCRRPSAAKTRRSKSPPRSDTGSARWRRSPALRPRARPGFAGAGRACARSPAAPPHQAARRWRRAESRRSMAARSGNASRRRPRAVKITPPTDSRMIGRRLYLNSASSWRRWPNRSAAAPPAAAPVRAATPATAFPARTSARCRKQQQDCRRHIDPPRQQGRAGQHREQDQEYLEFGFHGFRFVARGTPREVKCVSGMFRAIRADRSGRISRRSASHRRASSPPDSR